MNAYPYLAIGLGAVLVGAGPGATLFGSKTGGALVAALVFGFFAGLYTLLLGFN